MQHIYVNIMLNSNEKTGDTQKCQEKTNTTGTFDSCTAFLSFFNLMFLYGS